MSRQLKLSATLSVLAMALFALAGGNPAVHTAGFAAQRVEAKAAVPALPTLRSLLPGLQ